MAFLRNAYILVDFGDFVQGATSIADPYIQLLSTTNNSAAVHQDFVNVRLGGKDSTTDENSNNASSSSTSSNTKRIIIIAGAAGLGLLILVLGLCFCCFRKRGARRMPTGSVLGMGGQTYQPLQDPAPNAAYETHALPNLNYNGAQYGQGPPTYGGQQSYNPPPQPPYGSQQQYQTAWDHRY